MASKIIDVEHLKKSYGDVQAVKDISYEVYPGEIFAVLGPNGAGKTTTIRMTLGLIQPDGGSARLFGEPVTQETYRRIGYLPEERGLYQDVTALACLTYLASLKGLSEDEAKRRALEGLERVELADKANDKIKTFSRGMQQKVQFLATILHQPELIIVDEPFSGLDPVNTRLIEAIIFDLARQGTTVVMSTHQMQRIEQMADRLMMISRGERVLYGPVEEVRRQYATGSVLVKATGDLGALQGVDHVEHNNGRYELVPTDGVTPQDLLRQLALAPDVSVEEFEVALPSLDDVFVAVVREKQQ
jgi:ABC-2 type transport system ATP-binding protein